MPHLRLLVEEGIESVRMDNDHDYSMRSSTLNLAQALSPNPNPNFIYSGKRISSEFEDVFYEEKKSNPSFHTQTVAIENNQVTTEQGTDVDNLVKFNTSSTNTHFVKTDEK